LVRTAVRWMVILCACLHGAVAFAAETVLEGIEMLPDAKGTVVRIELTSPIRIVSHSPQKNGDLLHVQVQPIPGQGIDPCGLTDRQTLLWSATDTVPLIEVSYEGDGLQVIDRNGDDPCRRGRADEGRLQDALGARVTGRAEILLRFNRPVWFEVRPGSDPRYLNVTLLGATEGEVEVDQTQEMRDGEAVPMEPEPGPEVPRTPGALPDDQQGKLIEQARQAIIDKDYAGAVRWLTKLLGDPQSRYRREAQEMLGVARERAGQFAHAKAEYERFLKLYPEGEPAARVRQRLDGLLTAEQVPREKLRKSEREKAREKKLAGKDGAAEGASAGIWEKQTVGGLSQFWRRSNQYSQGAGTDPVQSTLENDLDVNFRARNDRYEARARFSGGYAYDFLANGPQPDTRVSSAYAELGDRDKRRSGRVGRQTGSKGGVLGRFDGGAFGYQVHEKVRLNLTAGLPVESSTNRTIHTEKKFYGLSADLADFWPGWDFNIFLIEQRTDDLLDRRATGAEARYFKDNKSLFALLDYDLSFGTLNTFMMLGNYQFPNRATMNFLLDHRNSPLTTLTSGLQGQPVDSIDELRLLMPVSQIRDLAEDRTAKSTNATLGGTYPLNDKFEINGDVTTTYTSDTEASGGVARSPPSGMDFMYALQLIGSSLFKDGDSVLLGARFSDMDSSDTVSLSLNTRHPITPTLRVNPQVQFSHGWNYDGTDDWSLDPSLRLNYRVKRWLQLELEGGGSYNLAGQTSGGHLHSHDYYVNLGYRADF